MTLIKRRKMYKNTNMASEKDILKKLNLKLDRVITLLEGIANGKAIKAPIPDLLLEKDFPTPWKSNNNAAVPDDVLVDYAKKTYSA